MFAALQATLPIGALVGTALAALGFGLGLALFVRAWELHVRTPARVLAVAPRQSFAGSWRTPRGTTPPRRPSVACSEYTAWAVAVGEVDH